MSIQEDKREASRPIQMWTALAHVMPREETDLLQGARGAFVNAIGPAQSSREFEKNLREVFAGLGFELIEIDDLEPLAVRESKREIPQELTEVAELSRATNQIHLGAFHAYEDADDLM